MHALITNDDGVDTVGIRTLAGVAKAAGLDVTIAAPREERSGSSAALSALETGGRLLVEPRCLEGVEDVDAFAVHASPAMIVVAAARGAFGGAPDVVLSGINHGPNTGRAILHSGTVGAAFTAASHGLPALAVSMATATPANWDTAAEAARRALDWFLPTANTPYVLNVNVPDVPSGELRGIKRSALASFGAVQAQIGGRGQGYVTMTFTDVEAEPEPGTDVALLGEGWATATALQIPHESHLVDLSSLA